MPNAVTKSGRRKTERIPFCNGSVVFSVGTVVVKAGEETWLLQVVECGVRQCTEAAKRDHESQKPGSERSVFHYHSFLNSYWAFSMCSTVFALDSQWWKRCGPCPLLIYSLATSALRDVYCYFLSKLWVVKITLPNSNMHVCMLSHFSRVWLFGILWTIVHQAPLFMGFSRQKYWSGLPCPLPGDLPHPGIKPHLFCPKLHLFCLLHRQAGSLSLALPGKPLFSNKDF